MSKETKLEKIVLKLEGKEISLSIEQSRKLWELLDELFHKQKPEFVPYPYPIYPIWETHRWIYYKDWVTANVQTGTTDVNTITCSL